MGFLKKLIPILFVLACFAGCSSVIKIPDYSHFYTFSMYGGEGERNFQFPVSVTDSLKLLWETETHGGFANTSVTIKDSLVFIGDLSGRVYCYELGSGKEIGLLRYKGITNSSILSAGNKIIFLLEYPNKEFSSVIFYDIKSGDELKNIKLKGKVSSEPILTDENVTISTRDGLLYMLNMKGELVWMYNLKHRVNSSPALWGCLLAVVSAEGSLFVFDFEAKKLLTTIQLDGIFEGGLTIRDGILYCGNNAGVVYAVDLRHDKILWKFNSKFRIKNIPVTDEKNVYIANLMGEAYSVTRDSGSLNWKITTDGLFDIAPAVTNDFLILPDQNRKILFIKKDSGKIEREFKVTGRNKLSPVIFNNSLFLGYEKGKVARYEFVK
jgi:outer membrane protein assembly factor BamB